MLPTIFSSFSFSFCFPFLIDDGSIEKIIKKKVVYLPLAGLAGVAAYLTIIAQVLLSIIIEKEEN